MQIIIYTIFFFVGSLVGIGIAFFNFHPMEIWDDGWDRAKEIFTDYDKGFKDGFDACYDYYFTEEKNNIQEYKKALDK